jgi:hypothetical protein
MKFEIPQAWTTVTADRECGDCYACCIHLGIEELKKYTGQTCKHLNGANPTKRCSIYASRPVACSGYFCLWRAGWGPEGLRPRDSGILVTGYDSERNPGSKVSMTVNVFDSKLASPYIMNVVGELITLPIVDEVRLIFLESKKATMFREGNVYDCQLLPPDNFESLKFLAHGDPVGTYLVEKEKIP